MRKLKSKGPPPCPRRGPRPRATAAAPIEAPPKPTSRAARLCELTLELLGRLRVDWGFASKGLGRALGEQRWLGSDERRALFELLFTITRQSRRLDFALEGCARLPPGEQRELARYLAFRLLEGELSLAEATAELPEVAWEEVQKVGERIERVKGRVRRFGLTHSLPDFLAAVLLDEHASEASALAEALNLRAPLVIRANTHKLTREALQERLARDGIVTHKTRLSPHGLVFEAHPDVQSLAAYREGLFEVQDEGSQLVAMLAAPPGPGLVVDACAGAGGKTLAIGAAMSGCGRLLALDISAKKLEELKRRARLSGLSNVHALVTPSDAWPAEVAELTGRIDRVLIDAPCSGTGALRRNPELRWRVQEGDLMGFAARQLELLRRGLGLLAREGRLIYATCSLCRIENEEVIDRALASTRGLRRVPIAEILGAPLAREVADESGYYLKTTPSRHGCDGFFAAVLAFANER